MGTTTIEKGGGLIAVTGITQTIAVIVNIIASWTIIIVMHIINTMIEGALVHHHPTAVNNESTFCHGDDDMHDNDDSPTSNDVDNDSNCLCDTSDSNESSSFLKGSSTYGDSKVFFN